MLALPDRPQFTCCIVTLCEPLSLCHPQITGVLPQGPCSNPGFGTTFVAARADGTSTNVAIAKANANPIREAGGNRRPDRDNVSLIRPSSSITAAKGESASFRTTLKAG
jgi:hypothetical protein